MPGRSVHWSSRERVHSGPELSRVEGSQGFEKVASDRLGVNGACVRRQPATLVGGDDVACGDGADTLDELSLRSPRP